MIKILVFLGCCIIVSGTSSNQVKQKRSLFGDIRISSSLPTSSYGYGHPWSRSRNPWKSLKITSDLYDSSPGLIYGSARPSPPISSPSVVLTKHVIVEKPVPVPGQPVVLEKQVHVPVPVEKIVPVTVEKSVPVAVPQIIPYPVERPSPIRQIGIPVPIFIAPQGLLFGSGSAPTNGPPAPSPTVPPPPPPSPAPAPVPIHHLPRPDLVQQPVQSQQQASSVQPISLSVSAGLSGIPFQIPVQMLSNNQVPVQIMSNNQVPLQMIPSHSVPIQVIPSSSIPVQVLASKPISRGIVHGLDSSYIQLPTLDTAPESVQSNSLSGVETFLPDDWKYD
ncbi:pollen-specific leucine-rich repeat extensin-like protein 4 [Chelonus insularis]|uniref:pollen-specific leucine-rich repeat extensin-like protein 4 n=1 Tax=Chelonus insularis TaxID=460826 RepID=UPI00158D23ED|nr:pollen-specific leucine-rich repeat extensin-like protein 4 [Chelonus insularis]